MKVKALRNCMFSFEGRAYRARKGEVLNVDVPQDKLDPRSFELVEQQEKVKKKEKPKASGEGE